MSLKVVLAVFPQNNIFLRHPVVWCLHCLSCLSIILLLTIVKISSLTSLQQDQQYSQIRSYLVAKLANFTKEQKLIFARKLWNRIHCSKIRNRPLTNVCWALDSLYLQMEAHHGWSIGFHFWVSISADITYMSAEEHQDWELQRSLGQRWRYAGQNALKN